MDLRSHLSIEFRRRRDRNRRYSMRAFAIGLGISHSTLSRLFRGGRRISAATVRRLVAKLGLPEIASRQTMLYQSESLILALVNRPGFQADSRWLATMTGQTIDDVNLTLHRLLHTRRLTMSRALWRAENPS